MYVETYRVSTQIESARPFLTLWWGFTSGNNENKGWGWVNGWVGVGRLGRELDSVCFEDYQRVINGEDDGDNINDVNDGSKDHQMVGGSY